MRSAATDLPVLLERTVKELAALAASFTNTLTLFETNENSGGSHAALQRVEPERWPNWPNSLKTSHLIGFSDPESSRGYGYIGHLGHWDRAARPSGDGESGER